MKRALYRIEAVPLLVGALALFAILALWTQVQPFASLSDYGVLNDPTQSNAARRNVTLLIMGAALLLIWRRGQLGLLWQACNPLLVAIFVWFAFTALLSPAPGLALNRLVLAGVVIVIAACLPLLFTRMESFAAVLGMATSGAILLCFGGAIFLPDLAIHSLRDTVEQGLAGDWRGMFRHKNDLAPMAIHFTLVGILLWQLRWRFWGGAIILGALLLLALSGGKTASLLLLPSLLGAMLIIRLGDRGAALVALMLLGGLALLTVGSVAFPPIGALVAHLPDPSFTGRADIWQLALEAIGKRPLTGYGYNVFWDTGATYLVAGTGDTAALVSHAHNGFLDTALSAGLPGLLLVIFWAGIAPLQHIAVIKRRRMGFAERAFLQYLVSAWLFTLLVSNLEAILFNRGDSIWFTGLLAIICLRFWAREELAR